VHKLARRFVDRVTFVTQEARSSFEAVHGPPVEDHRHLVVENGVVVAPAGTRRARPGRIRIGTVGRLVELKGQRYILDAVRGLAGVEVHLFGDGPEREALTAMARDLGVPVAFHGTVIDREQIYSSIDILVVASRTEGQSMAIMEAMARGIPAIATAVGGNPELVRDGETGLLVPPGNPLAIRGALARLVADPELRVRLGRASHARIAMHHSIDAVAEKYRAIYASP
jgi:glycosyltransferase involved in cell wall biosynthesis